MRDFDPQRDAGLVERVAQLAPTPPGSDARELLGRYLEQVATWNRKLDLTAAKGPEAQVEVMLADAMVLSHPQLCPAGARVVDVGTGAGAPIMPLLILRDDLSARCLEPLHKRAAFLRTASARLGLVQRMKVLEQRLDPNSPTPPEGAPFDLALSRATLAPDRWLQAGLELAPRVLVLLASDPPPSPPQGTQLVDKRDYTLPFSGAPRTIALYAR